jgi:4-amino-4-deoxy-L-arabinose transferase-like glycosyltransferase
MIQSTPTPTSRARVAEFASRLSAVVLALPWAWTVAVVLGATTLLARSPGIVFTGLFDRDEAFLQVMGGVVGRGGEMYVDVIDRKPPIVPYLYALVHELSVDMRWVRLLCACAIFVNGLVIVALVRRLTSNRRAALAAGVLAVLGTALFLPADAQAANFELWGLLPASAAILAVVVSRDPRRSRTLMFLLAGACVAFAANCKQPYVVVLLPVLFEAARPRVDRRRPVGAVSTVGAVVLGVVLATLPLLLVADPRRMWRWGWADNGDYLNGGISTSRALAVGAGLSLVFALFHLPLLYGLWAAVRRRVRVDPVLLVWLASSMLVLPIGLRFFGHYYQQLVPPLAAITGVALARAARTVRRAVLSLAALSSVALVGLAQLPVRYPSCRNTPAGGRSAEMYTSGSAPHTRIRSVGAVVLCT